MTVLPTAKSPPRILATKVDDLTPEHLGWLVQARYSNQQASLRLFQLLKSNPDRFRDTEASRIAQLFVAVSFSLWRAVFLADRTGTRALVIEDAIRFLGKVLTDNAINYSQDRSMREWSFNYYMNSAKDNLILLGGKFGPIMVAIDKKPPVRAGYKPPQRRWDRFEGAFEVAIDELAALLANPKRKVR